MKLYRYWVKEVREVEVGGAMQKVTCYGGSNESEAAARDAAERKIGLIEQKIAGRRGGFADYEAEIREEILETIDEHNVVTRNRYGAAVLNSESLVFLDIDEPVWYVSLFSFGKMSVEEKKFHIIQNIQRKASKKEYAGISFRIYETCSGIRLMAPGLSLDPRGREAKRLFRAFHADWLYGRLCRKQNCYRARLTPKPYRMKMKSMRVGYPRSEEEQGKVEDWVKQYERVRGEYAVCQLCQTIGPEVSDPVVEYHDRMTGVGKELKLA